MVTDTATASWATRAYRLFFSALKWLAFTALIAVLINGVIWQICNRSHVWKIGKVNTALVANPRVLIDSVRVDFAGVVGKDGYLFCGFQTLMVDGSPDEALVLYGPPPKDEMALAGYRKWIDNDRGLYGVGSGVVVNFPFVLCLLGLLLGLLLLRQGLLRGAPSRRGFDVIHNG